MRSGGALDGAKILRLAVSFCFLLGAAQRSYAIIDASLQLQLGNPTGATNDSSNHSHFLISRTVDVIDYSDVRGQPNWTAWDLTASDVGSSGRTDAWATDPLLPASFWPGSTATFGSVGAQSYDRGHMCPSADRTDNTTDNTLVFIMSNIIPQASSMNQGNWATLEGYCRTLLSTQEVLIMSGPINFGSDTVDAGHVGIASNVWKIAVCVPLGAGNALSRVSYSTRVIAVNVPNTDAAGGNPWTDYVTSVKQLQAATGYNFFTALSSNLAWVLRSKIDGQTPATPVFTSFSPASGSVGASVSIVGSNLDATTNVTFNATSATYTINSPTNITAIVPASATSGSIVVRTLGGSATSAGTFTVGAVAVPTFTVTPSTTFTSSGDPGGPFSPDSMVYTLNNTNSTALSWGVSDTAPWLDLSATSGTLLAGASTNITASITNTASEVLGSGAYGDTITFSNAATGASVTRAVVLSVNFPPTLGVSPSDVYEITGAPGGPYTPASQTYTLSNLGNSPLSWTANNSASWLTLSLTSGTLAAGASTTVVASVNANANPLPEATYSDTIGFTNVTNGFGSTTRTVDLTISTGPPSGMFEDVESGTNGWSVSGLWHVVGGGSSCSNSFSASHAWYYGSEAISCTYNTGGTTAGDLVSPALTIPSGGTLTFQSWEQTEGTTTSWDKRLVFISTNATTNVWIQLFQSTDNSAAWHQVSVGLSAYAGKAAQFRFQFNSVNAIANGFRGWYVDDIRVGGASTLVATPATAFSANGAVGGPFSPSSQNYNLSNTNAASVAWTASKTAAWVTLSATSGMLAPGTSTNITVSINSNANALSSGGYADTVTFNDVSTGGNITRGVSLTVLAPPNLAVSPTGAFTANGSTGGPFSPTAQNYTLNNTGGSAMTWTSSTAVTWLTLSPVSGTLAGGASITVVATVNANANILGVGAYTGTIGFTNLTNGAGNTNRTANLNVLDPSAGGFSDNIESGTNGWTATGLWHVMNQTATPCGLTAHSANRAWWYGLENGCWYRTGQGQANSGNLISPSFVVPAGANLIFWSYEQTEGANSNDARLVSISTNGAASWILLRSSINNAAVWYQVTNSLAAFAGKTAQLRFQFNASQMQNRFTGWLVDDVAVAGSPGLTVTPATMFDSVGLGGGSFNPSNQVYTLNNTGVTTLNWTGSVSNNWLSLSLASGSLAAGASTNVNVSVNANANALAVGAYTNSVNFVNSSGAGSTTRFASLQVATPPSLSVSPASMLNASGPQGGSFSPSNLVYTLSNTGFGTLTWSGSTSNDWLSLSSSAGTLGTGGSTNVTVFLNANANALGVGTFANSITFTNLTTSNAVTRAANLTVLTPATLSVTPGTEMSASGTAGGPFSPASQIYTLSNTGGASLTWSATHGGNWLGLSGTSGVITGGGNTEITVSLNANSLAAGSYTDTVSFVNVSNDAGTTNRLVTLVVNNTPAQIVTNAAALAIESCTPGNGVVDPGETVTMNFSVRNIGGSDTTNLVGTLLATGGVTASSGAQTYGVVAAGNTASQSFTFTANGTCGGSITATLQLQDGVTDLGTISYTIPLGQFAAIFTQNFDAVSAPALPAGWTTSAIGAQSNWVTSTAAADSAPNAAYSPDAAVAGVNELVSPAIALNTASAKLTFRHNYSLAAINDGGVLEIKIGSGSYTDIVAAGGSFVAGGYNLTLTNATSNPLSNRTAWSGSSGGFTTTVVNLPASAAGQNVQLRWRCAAGNVPGATSSSGTLAAWSFDGSNSAPVTVGANLSASIVTSVNAGAVTFPIGNPASGQAISANGFSTAAGFTTATSAFTFSLTVSNGFRAGVSSVSFDDQRSGTGPTNFNLQVSQVADFSSVIYDSGMQTSHIAVTSGANTFSPALSNLTGTIYFRLYGYKAGTANGTWRIDNLNLQGSIGAIGGGGGAGWFIDSISIADNVCCVTPPPLPPTASFTGTPLTGTEPLVVSFTDTSTGNVTNRFWNFGDAGSTNITTNVVSHVYTAGTYSVTLLVSGAGGSSTNSHANYVSVLTAFQAWQTLYFGSPGNPAAAANADADGDGQSNLQEFMTGTDPTNSVSVSSILSIVPEGEDVRITWPTATGRTNALQTSSEVLSNYADIFIATNTAAGTTNHLDSGAVTNVPGRYYRIRLVP